MEQEGTRRDEKGEQEERERKQQRTLLKMKKIKV